MNTLIQTKTPKPIRIYINIKLPRDFIKSVEDFLKKMDEDKYILLSRQEIMSDFELKSLSGARIEKGLNEFNKIIKISKVSKKEMKLNGFQSFDRVYIDFQRNVNSKIS